MASEPDNQDPGNSSHPPGAVVIKIFSTATAAEAAAALLDANNITCWLQADDCGGMLSALDAAHGVKLLVSPTDADEAKELLDAIPVTAAAGELDNPPPPGGALTPPFQPRKLSLPQIAAGVVVGVLLCLLYQWTAKLGTKTYRYDTDGDGKPDEIWVYKDGNYVESSYDRNFDGRMDSWNFFGPDGQVSLSKTDDNFDGTVDATRHYTNGIIATAHLDTDFNGTPDVTYSYKNELPSQADWQPNGTNIVTNRQFFRHGVLVEEWRDTNWDGSFDVTIQFDAFLNLVGTNAFKLLSPVTLPPR